MTGTNLTRSLRTTAWNPRKPWTSL
jgi:hypothetical protein